MYVRDPPTNPDSPERRFVGRKEKSSGVNSVDPNVLKHDQDEPLSNDWDDELPLNLLHLLPLKRNIKLVDRQQGNQYLVCSLNNVLQKARIASD